MGDLGRLTYSSRFGFLGLLVVCVFLMFMMIVYLACHCYCYLFFLCYFISIGVVVFKPGLCYIIVTF